jgi:hypothetical protein
MFRVPLPPRPTAGFRLPHRLAAPIHRAPFHRPPRTGPPPTPVCRFGGLRSFYIRHFSSLDSVMYRTSRILINTGLCSSFTTCDGWSGAHAVGPWPGGTPSRGRSRRNRRRKPSCTSRRRWEEDAGSAGRSRRSLCRRCILRTRRRAAVRHRGSRRCRDAPVGAPPEGNAKEVTRRRRRV